MPSLSETRGSLKRATIVNVLNTSDVVNCMFNPHEYTVSKQNQWSKENSKGLNVPKVKFTQGGPQTLKLQLFFDTYGTDEDVRGHTEPLWRMMLVADEKKQRNNKSEPPRVEFSWGKFTFRAVITSLSQKFTLFNKEGIPLRTTVDVTFQQVDDQDAYPRQNPTSGGGAALRSHTVQAGERLDWIAAQAYEDPAHWRLIASANKLRHPLRLRPGQQLIIPPLD